MYCKVNPETKTCDRCGRTLNNAKAKRICINEQDRARAFERITKGPRIAVPRIFLGEKVQGLLRSIGITEERVKKILNVKDCGCSRRKKTLDDVSEELAFRLEVFLNRAADFLFGDYISEQSERKAREITQRMNQMKNAPRPPLQNQ